MMYFVIAFIVVVAAGGYGWYRAAIEKEKRKVAEAALDFLRKDAKIDSKPFVPDPLDRMRPNG